MDESVDDLGLDDEEGKGGLNKNSGGSRMEASTRRLTACCVSGGTSAGLHCSSSTSLADCDSRD